LPSTTTAKIIVSSPSSTPNLQQTITSMKIGNSTLSIKPANIDAKPVVVTQNDPPPLAPLSIQSNKTPQIKQTITLTPQDGSKTVSLVPPSQKTLTSNKMLVDLLDKKAPEPPLFNATPVKRKLEGELDSQPAKKVDMDTQESQPKTADLFAKLTQSILDSDEEMEDEIEKAIPTKVIDKKVIEVKPAGQQQQIINANPVQRQIIMGPNNQVILSPQGQHQTTATIKTDSGIQTVPIILQNNAIQGIQGQTIIQQQQPTQYILATNQQGQTYVVAQQHIQQQPQQILVAQNPNQQTKTIIILQQNQGQQQQAIQVGQQPQQQKIIMTPSGQQVIYSTQRPVIQNQIQSPQLANRKIVFTNTVDGAQSTPGGAKIIQTVQPTQNIQLVQQGKKFQIGNTQISQVIQQNPQSTSSVTIQAQSQQQQAQTQQNIQVIPKAPTPVIIQKTESPPSTAASTPKPAEKSTSNSPQPEQVTTTSENENSLQATPVVTPKESPSPSTTSSGTSSPAPKQQVSIQIPVPQSQIVGSNAQQYSIKIIPAMDPSKVKDEEFDINWPYVCDWRGCPRKKFSSANEVYLHACAVHCPQLEGTPDLFCQWGGGNTLCDNLPRKRFSLMTHIFDRHCTQDAFKLAIQKRLAAIENGTTNTPKQPYPVTLIRQPNNPQNDNGQGQGTNLVNGPTNIQNAGAAAMQAIKRHSIDFNIAKEASIVSRKEIQNLCVELIL
jgi:AT-rich interactive domain-containing protein 2